MTQDEKNLISIFEMELDTYYGYLASAEKHKQSYLRNVERFSALLKKRSNVEDDGIKEAENKTPFFSAKLPRFDAS